jgi:homoserine acetyltransferase
VTAGASKAPAAPGAQGTTWKSVPTQVVSAGGVDFAYRELGQRNGGTPVVFLVHLAAVLDNWDPRVVDGMAAKRTENRDKEITVAAYVAQLQALSAWGQRKPADLSAVKQPVLVVNGDDDRMVPTRNSYDLARRLPDSQLIIYPDAGHGGVFQFHEDFVSEALAFLAQ